MRFLNPNGATFNRPKLRPIDQLLISLNLKKFNLEENANVIQTTKYTFFNFVPKNLFEQFHKIANVYFLLLVILQFVPAFGVSSAALGVIPLLFILVATATKDGFEDYKRHQQDKFVNNQIAHVLESPSDLNQLPDLSQLNQLKWKNIGVGRLIFIAQDQPIPTDCLIFATSDPGGICYVETKNLDGETNLKIYESISLRNENDEDPHLLINKWFNKDSISIEYEDPTPNLYQFHGALSFNNIKSSLSFKHVLLRGSILRNTTYAIGLCLYSGPDTKIMLNTRPTPTKRSKIDKQLNPLVAFNFLIIFTLCLITSIGYTLTNQYPILSIYPSDYPKYASLVDASTTYNFLFAFGASLILYQNIVPISVYISIEFVKILSAYFIHADLSMHYTEPSTNITYPANPKSWTIADDLGQIKYIFSDKTGTLTQNIMEFKKCSINGIAYGLTKDDIKIKLGQNASQADIENTYHLLSNQMQSKSLSKTPKSPTFIDVSILDHLSNAQLPSHTIHPNHPTLISQFFQYLAICHTVLLDPISNQYKSQSPDEAALVATARDMGFIYNGIQNDIITINNNGHLMQIPLFHVIEFTSTRKRMSVVVKIDSEYILICKGADSVIMERMAPNQEQMLSITNDHLSLFANQGLRTLCIAYRRLSHDEYTLFDSEYLNASTLVTDDRDANMAQIASNYESNLMLLGCTAIDDKLQQGVSDTIKVIHKCGIKLWVLTGDKLETAITIGMSCQLITKQMLLLIISVANMDELRTSLNNIQQQLLINKNACLVMDGHSMTLLWSDPELLQLFTKLSLNLASVLMCRTSPKQKSLVVALIKSTQSTTCLAIGDGANDVAMIQSADIGIGISGLEGMQASMSSDFSIHQFKSLKPLLLVHGRYAYMRISLLIINFFYKNCIWVFTLFYYQFYCGFSTIFLFDYFYLLLYNVILTLLPVLLLGIFDMDVLPTYAYLYPQLYLSQNYFNFTLFLAYLLDAVYSSLIVYYGGMLMLIKGDVSNGIGSDSTDYYGAMTSIAIIMIANISVGLDIRKWHWSVVVGVIGSAMSLFIIIPMYSRIIGVSGTAYGVGGILYGQLSFYLYLVVVVYLGILPRLVIKSYLRMCYPRDGEIVMELAASGGHVRMETGDSETQGTGVLIMDAMGTSVVGNRGYAYSQGDRGVIGKIKRRLKKKRDGEIVNE